MSNPVSVDPVKFAVALIKESERQRLLKITPEDVTDEDIEAIEDELSMGHGAWDMEDPKKIVAAVMKVMCGKEA